MGTDATAAVLADRVVLTAPDTLGPNAVIGTLLPRALHASLIAVGHDGHRQSAACADQFAHHAIHGGFATDAGFTWNRPAIHLYGCCVLEQLLEAAGPAGHAAIFTTAPGVGDTGLRIYTGDGRAVTEETGLAELRARLATGRPALPVNSLCIGTITDHRAEGTQ